MRSHALFLQLVTYYHATFSLHNHCNCCHIGKCTWLCVALSLLFVCEGAVVWLQSGYGLGRLPSKLSISTNILHILNTHTIYLQIRKRSIYTDWKSCWHKHAYQCTHRILNGDNALLYSKFLGYVRPGPRNNSNSLHWMICCSAQ